MATHKVAQLVRGLAREPGLVQALRADAAALTRRFALGPADRAALVDADRFFKTEKPITTEAKPARAATAAKSPLMPPAGLRRPMPRAAGLAAAFTASSDTGTLLPGPDTGTFHDPLTGTAPTAPGAPGPAPAPGVPAAPAPAPAVPAVPGSPAPGIPSVPGAPPMPGWPSPGQPGPALPGWPPAWPGTPPGGWPAPGGPAPGQALGAPPCGGSRPCSHEAIVAIVAMANATSQTAITAITALANRKNVVR